jgi:hypothetical protein
MVGDSLGAWPKLAVGGGSSRAFFASTAATQDVMPP